MYTFKESFYSKNITIAKNANVKHLLLLVHCFLLSRTSQCYLILGVCVGRALADYHKLAGQIHHPFSSKTSSNSSLLHLSNIRGHCSNALTTNKIQISSIIQAPKNLLLHKKNKSKILHLARLLSAKYFYSTLCGSSLLLVI